MTPTFATACASLPPEGAAGLLGAARRWPIITPTFATSCASLPPEGAVGLLGAAQRWPIFKPSTKWRHSYGL
jgi:hypothetical protein